MKYMHIYEMAEITFIDWTSNEWPFACVNSVLGLNNIKDANYTMRHTDIKYYAV